MTSNQRTRQWLLLFLLILLAGCKSSPVGGLFGNWPTSTNAPFVEPTGATARPGGAAQLAAYSDSTSSEGTYSFTPDNTEIKFVGSAGPMRQSGSFEQFSGTFHLPSGRIEDGRIDVQIDMNSIKTKIGLLTRHLKAKDFFDVSRFPTSRFVSTAIQPTGEPGRYLISGSLTIHGVTQNVQLPALFRVGGDQVEISIEYVVRQTDFGMETGARKAKNDVPVTIVTKLRR